MDELSKFIDKFGKPYKLEDDDYEVEPFQENIDDASKSSAIYNMHMYWTKQDPYVVKKYIEHYTKQGDIVLDAFAGTGMTGVAAMMCGRHAILGEISPACIHIARNYTTPIEARVLQGAYLELKDKVEAEISPFYRTKCHNCGYPEAKIANIVLSDVYRCPRCSGDVLFAGDGRWERMKVGEKVAKIRCSYCGNEFAKATAEFVRIEPIELRVDCPKCGIKGEAKTKRLDEEDWELYINIEGGPTKVIHEGEDEWSGYKFEPVRNFANELGNQVYREMLKNGNHNYIGPKEVPYWYPKEVRFPRGYNTRQPLKRGITFPYQMFSRRNLIGLSILWHYINQNENTEIKEKLRFALTGILFSATLMCQWQKGKNRGGSINFRTGTLYIPSVIKEFHPIKLIFNKIEFLIQTRQLNISNSKIIVYLGSATNLPNIPENSIDYLYFDPPYGSNINYSELNLMWETWLGQKTDTKFEIIENESQGKGRFEYQTMMTEALSEAYRVLKPGRWLSIVYSYADPSMYRTVQKMADDAGFVDEGDVLHVNSKRKTKAQIDSDKTQQRFLVINFKKLKTPEKKKISKSEDIELDVIRVISEFLSKHHGQTRDYIYDQVIKKLFKSVEIDKFDLDEILKNFFKKVGDEWYSPGTLIKKKVAEGQGDLFEKTINESSEKEVIFRLQEFLKKYKRVPYSELREYFLRKIKIPLDKSFDEIVQDNFINEQGKIRLPSPREQEVLQNLSFQYTKGTIKRFLDSALRRTPSINEKSDWIEFCYKNGELDKGLYKNGWLLFQTLDESETSGDRFKTLKKIAEICKIKSE